MNKLFRPEQIILKDHPEITERIIQEKIAEDPSILGLGDLILKDKERIQPRAGRLDLLLYDPELNKRYEVEIQLGKSDESHIIRTIEYWDIEKKRYPQYEHCAVIVAEDITSRFLNVIGLFNGFIPLIAIQMKAFKFDDKIGLVFTKVLDEMELGLEEDDDNEIEQITTRDYWIQKKASNETIQIADTVLVLLNEVSSGHDLRYTKYNLRFSRNGQFVPYLTVRPRKRKHVVLALKTAKSDEIDKLIEENDLDDMGYMAKGSKYRIRISSEDVTLKREALKEIIRLAEKKYND
ncbi:MAG: hypothetical protein KF687_15860 [Cyclobacteriaceae bacterium]|nr:hypothetical protein [Cyclobacteriaceae bacterium]